MNDKTMYERLQLLLQRFWNWLCPYIISFFVEVKKLWKKYHVNKILILIGLTVSLAGSAYLLYLAKEADVETLKAGLEQTTTIYDINGEEAGSPYSQKGTFISLEEVAPVLEEAVISTEDRRFYEHRGFDMMGIGRAAVGFVVNGGNISGGGSTLTQQLAKNAFLTLDQTLSRKLKELFLAIEIEKQYNKTEILEMYLNHAYFGNGVWGVEDASHKYFGKPASEVNLSEAATLAGMLKAPSRYNPLDSMENARNRREVVLALMVDNGVVDEATAKNAAQEELVLQDNYQKMSSYNYPDYFDAVITEATEKYMLEEEEILNRGYKIYTSLNQEYQQALNKAYENDSLFQDAADGTLLQSGSVVMDPKTGGVYAIEGGRGEHVFRGFNRATLIKRQPGSVMKPLAVYTPALEEGYEIDSMLKDEKMSYGADDNVYSPENFDNTFSESGEVPLYEAVADSLNAPAVWLLNEIGLNKGIKKVEKFGITLEEADKHLALALGGTTTGVSPLQIASAYTVFANEGVRSEGHFITKIVDATGAIVVDNTEPKTNRVTSPEVAEKMTSLLMGVFTNGTGSKNNPSGYTVAGKTGSTQTTFSESGGTTDQWTVGYTPDIVVATWIGFDRTDEDHYMKTTSVTGVGPLFKVQMENLLPETPLTAFGTEAAEVVVENTNRSEWTEKLKESINYWGTKVEEGAGEIKEKAGSLFGQFVDQLDEVLPR